MGMDPTKAGRSTSSKRSSNTPDGPLTNQDSAHDVDLLRELAFEVPIDQEDGKSQLYDAQVQEEWDKNKRKNK